MMKNSKKMSKKYMKALSNQVRVRLGQLRLMLQTLQRRRNYIGAILSDEHTLIIMLITIIIDKSFIIGKKNDKSL